MKSKMIRLQFINKSVNYNKIFKRTMLKTIKKITEALEESATRNYVTWAVVKRKNPPIKTQPHPGPDKNSDGSTQLKNTDHSGQNHPLLVDIDPINLKNNEDIPTHGSFSTKESPYNNTKPTEISKTTLDKQNKAQFLHEKDNTFIKKDAVEVDIAATKELQNNPEMIKHCNRIIIEKNLE